MRTWIPDPADGAALQHALAGVVQAVGRPQFAATALQCLQPVLAAGTWSVYRLRPGSAPVLHLAGAAGAPDTTASCFAAYCEQGLYRCDSSFDAVGGPAARQRPVLLHMRAEDAPSSAHREAIYRRHGMTERLSVAQREADGSLLAVNLYRHQHQRRVDHDDLQRFNQLGPVLMAAVARHLQWQAEAADDAARAGAADAPDLRQRLRGHCAQLTPRELDVLQAMLQGLTYDGIAVQLGLSVGSVKTYRARAFQRLGIHFKSELFALLMLRTGLAS